VDVSKRLLVYERNHHQNVDNIVKHLQSDGELKANDRMKSWEDSHHKDVRPCYCKAKMKNIKRGTLKLKLFFQIVAAVKLESVSHQNVIFAAPNF